jgi:hypothetical protein
VSGVPAGAESVMGVAKAGPESSPFTVRFWGRSFWRLAMGIETWGTVSWVVTVLVTPLGTLCVAGPTVRSSPTTVRSKAVSGRAWAGIGARKASAPAKSSRNRRQCGLFVPILIPQHITVCNRTFRRRLSRD